MKRPGHFWVMDHYLHGTRTRSGEFIPTSFRLWRRMRQSNKQIPIIRTEDKPFFIKDDVYIGSDYICITQVEQGPGDDIYDTSDLL